MLTETTLGKFFHLADKTALRRPKTGTYVSLMPLLCRHNLVQNWPKKKCTLVSEGRSKADVTILQGCKDETQVRKDADVPYGSQPSMASLNFMSSSSSQKLHLRKLAVSGQPSGSGCSLKEAVSPLLVPLIVRTLRTSGNFNLGRSLQDSLTCR